MPVATLAVRRAEGVEKQPCDNKSQRPVDDGGRIPIIRALATVIPVISGLWGVYRAARHPDFGRNSCAYEFLIIFNGLTSPGETQSGTYRRRQYPDPEASRYRPS